MKLMNISVIDSKKILLDSTVSHMLLKILRKEGRVRKKMRMLQDLVNSGVNFNVFLCLNQNQKEGMKLNTKLNG